MLRYGIHLLRMRDGVDSDRPLSDLYDAETNIDSAERGISSTS